jgi:radical SAM superfamily enzyme YgiQ (UPF0313 family)
VETFGVQLLLVMPPQLGLLKGFSTGLISLANYVADRLPDVVTEILDFSATSNEELEHEITSRDLATGDDLVVGITTTTASYLASLRVAELFKKTSPGCLVVFGGHHASADAETILRHHSEVVDFIIVGEGEKALAQLVAKRRQPDVFLTPGLAFLHNDKFYQNPSSSFLTQQELDRLPVTFRGAGLFGTPGKFDHVTYVSARGCPLKCAFCSVANEKIRAKSALQVVEDIRELTRRGFSRIAIEDNFFAHSPARTLELCKALAVLRLEGVEFNWDCQTRVESMARHGTVSLLADAGCEAVYIGVESLNNDHLIYLNKVNQPQRYVAKLLDVVVPELLDSPLNCYLNLQLGIPGENYQHLQNTFSILQRLGGMAAAKKKSITIFPQLHVVYPGTVHFHSGVKEGRYPKYVFESFTRWEAQQAPVLTWLGEHFAHGTGGLPEGLLKPEKLRQEIYEVNVDAVFLISSALKSIDRIPGINVFNYGGHLVEDRLHTTCMSPLTNPEVMPV